MPDESYGGGVGVVNYRHSLVGIVFMNLSYLNTYTRLLKLNSYYKLLMK